MYYDRKLTDVCSSLIEENGSLRWLYNYVKKHEELDFLVGKNDSTEWISVYRGLSRILTINTYKRSKHIKISAAKAYKEIATKYKLNIYGKHEASKIFKNELDLIVNKVAKNTKFDRYYKNKKEGYFQNILSRKYGICGKPGDDFAIVDKEAVIGYKNESEKKKMFGELQKPYKKLQKELSQKDAKRFGKDLDKKAIGNELDFLALDKQGNLLLIEYKHGKNTPGIYLSPLQIGMYYDLFYQFPWVELEKSVYGMLEQKKRIGLINPQWKTPVIKDIVPVLIISEYNYNSSAKSKYKEVMDFVRYRKGRSFLENIKTYNYTTQNGIRPW